MYIINYDPLPELLTYDLCLPTIDQPYFLPDGTQHSSLGKQRRPEQTDYG